MTNETATEKAETIAKSAIEGTRFNSQMTAVNEEDEGIEITVLMFDGIAQGLRSTYQSEKHDYAEIDWEDFEEFIVESANE